VPAEEGQPIVLVVIDTLRADRLESPSVHTPTLDALVGGGLTFDRAWSPAPWTLPAFGSLLTGLPPSEHGAGVAGSLEASVDTVAERLAEAGYATAAVVTNPWLLRAYGLDQGFQVYDDRLGPSARPLGLHPASVLGWEPVPWPLMRSAAEVTEAALGLLESQPGSRWFLLVHFMDVHGPHDLPPDASDAAYTAAYDAALERCAGSHQVLAMVLEEFAASTANIEQDLETLVKSMRFEELARQAHSLKGASGNIGAEALSAKAGTLEEAAKKSLPEGMEETVRSISEELRAIHKVIDRLRAESQGAAS
jgi:HPt (histidine-containing phosphotransfer) domain-containing protein